MKLVTMTNQDGTSIKVRARYVDEMKAKGWTIGGVKRPSKKTTTTKAKEAI